MIAVTRCATARTSGCATASSQAVRLAEGEGEGVRRAQRQPTVQAGPGAARVHRPGPGSRPKMYA